MPDELIPSNVNVSEYEPVFENEYPWALISYCPFSLKIIPSNNAFTPPPPSSSLASNTPLGDTNSK